VEYVVDQNVMRRTDLRSQVAGDRNYHFIFPDTAIAEMTQSTKWQDTIRSSFDQISNDLRRIRSSISASEALRYELTTGKAITKHALVNGKLSANFRKLLKVLRQNDSEKNNQIEEDVEEFRTRYHAEEETPERARLEVLGLIEKLQHGPANGYGKDMRAGRMSREAKLGWLHDRVPEVLANLFPNKNWEIDKIASHHPFIYRWTLLRLLNALRWVEKGGGWDAVNPGKLLNGLRDLDYVLTATFFDRLITNDKSANSHYNDLVTLLDTNKRDFLFKHYFDYIELRK
jgi:hypothetical protein